MNSSSVVTAWSQTGHHRTSPDITTRTVHKVKDLLRRTVQHETTRRNTAFRGFDSPQLHERKMPSTRGNAPSGRRDRSPIRQVGDQGEGKRNVVLSTHFSVLTVDHHAERERPRTEIGRAIEARSHPSSGAVESSRTRRAGRASGRPRSREGTSRRPHSAGATALLKHR